MAADLQRAHATPDGKLQGTSTPADQKVVPTQVGVMLMDTWPTDLKNGAPPPVAATEASTTAPSPVSTLDFGVLVSPICLWGEEKEKWGVVDVENVLWLGRYVGLASCLFSFLKLIMLERSNFHCVWTLSSKGFVVLGFLVSSIKRSRGAPPFDLTKKLKNQTKKSWKGRKQKNTVVYLK